ncbi:MAG: hypothetical protein SNJ69_13415, partial [Chloroflexaceae bacterium]
VHRVRERDDNRLTLTLHSLPEARRTLPLRRCAVQVRDRLDQRLVRGQSVAWGRVMVDEEVYGFRQVSPGAAMEEQHFAQPLAARWSAPALWIDLPMALNAEGQLVGWSLVAALPLLTLAGTSDVVPAYDAEAQRIYFVDAQPGGNGLAVWLFEALESVLPTAYAVALDGRADPLLKPLARADMDWMLALLGGVAAAPVDRNRELVMPEPAPLRREAPRQEGPRAAPPPVDAPVARGEPPAPPPEKAPPRRKAARATAPRGSAPGGLDRQPSARPRPEPATPKREDRPAQREASASPPPPAAPEEPGKPAPPESVPGQTVPPPGPADPVELVARLRAQRMQRQRGDPTPAPKPATGGEPRFRPGDSIVCVPHGRGTVVSSRAENGREILRVHFAGLGEVLVDASVNAVRLAGDDAPGEA